MSALYYGASNSQNKLPMKTAPQNAAAHLQPASTARLRNTWSVVRRRNTWPHSLTASLAKERQNQPGFLRSQITTVHTINIHSFNIKIAEEWGTVQDTPTQSPHLSLIWRHLARALYKIHSNSLLPRSPFLL